MDFNPFDSVDELHQAYNFQGPKRNISRYFGSDSTELSDPFAPPFSGFHSPDRSARASTSTFTSSTPSLSQALTKCASAVFNTPAKHRALRTSSSALNSPAPSLSSNKCITCVLDSPIVAHCAECQGYLCQNCFKCHRNMRMFANHTIEETKPAERCHLTLPQYCLTSPEKVCPDCLKLVKTLSHGSNSLCNILKNEPCSPASDGSFKEFTPMKMKLNYDVNFGSFGVEDGQFAEPAGICVTSEGLIAVTDTKNHRVQVFDEIGCLKLSFGVPGTSPGQILYPNCIASCPLTGNFIITERTPIHQVQVYSSDGEYVRRFGQNLIQFPRGVCVDKNGNIIVVECKVMRITIFDQFGSVQRTFCAPSVMSFPMDICCNDSYEIFVVDNRRHCVHVFDYNGTFLRNMCSNGSISFPISVGINSLNELVVTDNHQSFNMTFFTQHGELIRAYESRNRHPQCLAAAVLAVDKIFLATKDYRVYMYDCSSSKNK